MLRTKTRQEGESVIQWNDPRSGQVSVSTIGDRDLLHVCDQSGHACAACCVLRRSQLEQEAGIDNELTDQREWDIPVPPFSA
jgi:hypothetical protein